jgi:serine/threonine protein kinase
MNRHWFILHPSSFILPKKEFSMPADVVLHPQPTINFANPGRAYQRGSLVGQVFDSLEIIEEIGRGGMGVVYKARQESLDRYVAVKLLLAEHACNETRLARFQAEACASARLEHKNIIQVFHVGQCVHGHYFTMELIDGHSLESLIQKGKIKIPSAVALTIVLAEAMHYAHSHGVVHRDLKPANILVDRTLRPVIMDFGIAKQAGRLAGLTPLGVIMGTPAYMAPEQARGTPNQVGPQSDVYSLGAILYTMLTRRPPFEDQNPLHTVLKVIGPDMPRPIRSIEPLVPQRLERICAKCMAKAPAERYPDARSLARDLRRLHRRLMNVKSGSTVKRRASVSTKHESMPSLILEAVDTGKRIRVGGTALVGRTSDCDVVVRAADVSKQHCRITVGNAEVLVEDLGSSNGTFVNEQRIKHSSLNDGDRLSIADHEFLLHIWRNDHDSSTFGQGRSDPA